MVLRAFSVLSVIVFGLCAAQKLDLPVPTCKRDSSNYNSCLKRAISEAWPLFVKGLPAEFEFPPIDPFFYKYGKAVVDNDVIYGEIAVSNITIEGYKDVRIMAVRSHFSNDFFRLVLHIHISKIFADGSCDASGTLGGFRMGGRGHYNLTAEDIEDSWDISGPVKNDTWIIEHFVLFPMFKSFKIHLDNLFEGNREINDLAEMFANEYWPLLTRILMPIASKTWDSYFSDLLTHLFAKLSFSQLFP